MKTHRIQTIGIVVLLAGIAGVLGIHSSVFGEPGGANQAVPYSGRLVSSDGSPIADDSHSMRYQVYRVEDSGEDGTIDGDGAGNITGTNTTFTRQLQAGDEITVTISGSDETRIVDTVTDDTTLTLLSGFSSSFSGKNYTAEAIYTERRDGGQGTVSVDTASDDTQVNGTSTHFTEQFNSGDDITLTGSGVTKTVSSVQDDTTLTVQTAFSSDKSGENYDIGNSACDAVTTDNGRFNVNIGACNTDISPSILNDSSLYLEVQLDTDSDTTNGFEETFLPRKQLGASPYAFNSVQLVADGNGNENTFGISSGGDAVFDNTDSGNFGIGVSNPSVLTAIGDADTGFENPATDELALTTGGSERVRVDSSGNVGIGMTSPSSKVEIAGGELKVNRAGESARATIAARADTSKDARVLLQPDDNPFKGWNLVADPNDTFDIRHEDGDVRFTIDDSNNNVGIGTASPSRKLEIVGGELKVNQEGEGAEATITARGDTGNEARVLLQPDSDANKGWNLWGDPDDTFDIRDESGNVEFTIDDSNNGVGIGTTSVQNPLDVAGSVHIEGNNDSNKAGGNTPLDLAIDDSDSGINVPADGVLAFWRDGGEEMRIQNDKLGIGTTSPSSKVEIASGDLRVNRVGEGAKATIAARGGTGKDARVLLQPDDNNGKGWNLVTDSNDTFDIRDEDGDVRFTIDDSNDGVGIGTTSPSNKLTVSGDADVTGSLGIGTSSPDRTLDVAGGLTVDENALEHDSSTGETSVDQLNLGAQSFETDSGKISWIDMPVTSSASSGTVQSYTAQVDGQNLLTVYAESDGSGGIQNARAGISTTDPEETLHVDGSACITSDNSCDTAVAEGEIAAETLFNSGADLAEVYPSQDSLASGLLVSAARPSEKTLQTGEITRASAQNSGNLLGVISQDPGTVLGAGTGTNLEGYTGYEVALSGRVQVKVSEEAGSIEPGDPLTLGTNGKATKATTSGYVVGTALEPYEPESDQTEILAFIRRRYHYADSQFHVGSEGRVGVGTTDPDARLQVAGNLKTDNLLQVDGTGQSYVEGSLQVGAGADSETALDIKGNVTSAGSVTIGDSETNANLRVSGSQYSAKNITQNIKTENIKETEGTGDDTLLVDTKSQKAEEEGLTVTLSKEDRTSVGKEIIVKDKAGNASQNNITIETETNEEDEINATIDGKETYTIKNDYQSVTLRSDGEDWVIVGITEGEKNRVTTDEDRTTEGEYTVLVETKDIMNNKNNVTITLSEYDLTNNHRITVKDKTGNASADSITIEAEKAQIDGNDTVSIDEDKGSITVTSDGSEWYVVE